MGTGGAAPAARVAAITRAARGEAGGDWPAAGPGCAAAPAVGGSAVHDPREPSDAAPAASTQALDTVRDDQATEGCATLGTGLLGATGVGLRDPPGGVVVEGSGEASPASLLGSATSPGATVRAAFAADSQELPSADGAAGETARTVVWRLGGGIRGAGAPAGGAGGLSAPGGSEAMVGPLEGAADAGGPAGSKAGDGPGRAEEGTMARGPTCVVTGLEGATVGTASHGVVGAHAGDVGLTGAGASAAGAGSTVAGGGGGRGLRGTAATGGGG